MPSVYYTMMQLGVNKEARGPYFTYYNHELLHMVGEWITINIVKNDKVLYQLLNKCDNSKTSIKFVETKRDYFAIMVDDIKVYEQQYLFEANCVITYLYDIKDKDRSDHITFTTHTIYDH